MNLRTRFMCKDMNGVQLGLFKTEVISRWGPWRTLEAVAFGTLEWVDRLNNRRLRRPIRNIPPLKRKSASIRNPESSPWWRDLNQPASGKSGAVPSG